VFRTASLCSIGSHLECTHTSFFIQIHERGVYRCRYIILFVHIDDTSDMS